MQRVVRLYQLWSWLPHFRAIAETEHLPTASTALGISPSALSRALKQLEADVGQQLFIRDGRDIRINEAGEELLRGVRLAMRSIDDALGSLADNENPRTLRISAPGPIISALLLDVVAAHTAEFPHIQVEFSSCSLDEIVSGLSRGTVDVCIHEQPVAHEDVESHQLANSNKVLACSGDHPLAEKSSPLDVKAIQAHAFVVPVHTAVGIHPDGWPADVPRLITMRVKHMQMGIDACLSGRYLALLPRSVVQANGLKELVINGVQLPVVHNVVTVRRQVRKSTNYSELNSFLDRIVAVFATASNATRL